MKTENLVKMIEKLDIELQWINKNVHGNCNLRTSKIKLNVETMVVEVFLHELMHLCHPLLNHEEDESVIDTLVERLWERLTAQQVREMAGKLLRRKYGDI